MQAIVLTDRNGTILWTNDGVRTLFDSDPATCIGDRIERWMPRSIAKGHATRMAQFLRTRKGNIVGTRGRRVEAVRDDGSLINVLLTVQVDERGPEPLFVATMTDLGRHDEQAALSARVARLEAEKAAREEVLAFVTHEVRNALAPVRIAVDNLLADVPSSQNQMTFAPSAPEPPAPGQGGPPRPGAPGPTGSSVSGRPRAVSTVEADASTLRLLGHSTDAALEILNGILDIERLRRGKSLLADWFSLDDMLDHVHKTAVLVGGEAGVDVSEDSGEDVRALDVFAAENKLAQCLTNFVTNAIKFTPDGGTVTIYACVEETTPASALRPAAPASGDQRAGGRPSEPDAASALTPAPPSASAAPGRRTAAAGAEDQSRSSRESGGKADGSVKGPPSISGHARPPPLTLCSPKTSGGSAAPAAEACKSISTGYTDAAPRGPLSLEARAAWRSAGKGTGTGVERDLQSNKGSGGPCSVQRTPYNRISSLTEEEETPAAQAAPPSSKEDEDDDEDEQRGGGADWRSRRASVGGRSSAGPPSSASTSTTAREYTDGSSHYAQPAVPQLSDPVDVGGGGERGDGEFSAYSPAPQQGPPETPLTWTGAEVEVDEDGDEQQQWLRLGVRDTGAGVPPEQRDRLFTVFEQLPNRKTRKGVGTGLGLAFVREVVERGHGGRVGLESEGTGKGADFFILIPLRQTRVGDGDEQPRAQSGAETAASRLRGDATGRRASPTPAPRSPRDIEEGECMPAQGAGAAGEGGEEGGRSSPEPPHAPPVHAEGGTATGQSGQPLRPPTLSMTDTSSLRPGGLAGREVHPSREGHARTPQPAGADHPGMQRLTMQGSGRERRPLGRRAPRQARDGSLSARSAARLAAESPFGAQSPTQSVGRCSARGPASSVSRSTRGSRRSDELPFLPKVLVVDDSGIVAKLLARRLSAWGAVARTASSGEDALRQLEEAEAEGTPFHCLVTDLNMPEAEVQGDQLARRAAVLWPTLAIIITSGDDQATAPGAHARLVKPVSAIKLFSTIRRHVGRMHRRHE